MKDTAERPTAPRLDGLGLGLLFLGLYELLRQHTIPGDGTTLLYLAKLDSVTHPVHFWYLPLLGALRSVFGESASVFAIASHLSCVTAAFALTMTHAGFRTLRLGRRDAATATALVGVAPAVVFYATAVELHAPFFAVASLAFVAAARLGIHPTLGNAGLLGLATGVSYSAHATGALLPMPLLFVAWTIGTRDGVDRSPIQMGGWAALTVVVAALHCTAMWGLPAALRAIDPERFFVAPDNARNWIANNSVPWNQAIDIAVTVWNEWLLTFALISVCWLRAATAAATRRMALGLALSLLPYLGISFLLLARHSERGAYLLPLAWLAAWLVVRSWRPAQTLALSLAGATIAVMFLGMPQIRDWDSMVAWRVAPHDDREYGAAFARGLRHVAGESELAVLTGGYHDVAACFVYLPDAALLRIEQLSGIGEEALRRLMPDMDAALAKWFGEGRRIFLTDVVEAVSRPGVFAGSEILDPIVLAHLRANYRLGDVESDGFRGMELTAK